MQRRGEQQGPSVWVSLGDGSFQPKQLGGGGLARFRDAGLGLIPVVPFGFLGLLVLFILGYG